MSNVATVPNPVPKNIPRDVRSPDMMDGGLSGVRNLQGWFFGDSSYGPERAQIVTRDPLPVPLSNPFYAIYHYRGTNSMGI
jgi:hypothetical protein